MPSKGRDYTMMLRSFEEYNAKNNASEELKVYRATSKNYLKISSWCSYKGLAEWNHEYLAFWKRF